MRRFPRVGSAVGPVLSHETDHHEGELMTEQVPPNGIDRRSVLRAAALVGATAAALAVTGGTAGPAFGAEPRPVDPGPIPDEYPDPSQFAVDMGRAGSA